MKVLIVDDSEVNRSILSRALQNFGISKDHIFQAENGQIAVEMVLNGGCCFDIIFMDHLMPVMQGDEATRQIRALEEKQQCSKSYIVTCSSSHAAIFPDANDSLPKPLDLTKLNALVARIKMELKELHPQDTKTLAPHSAPIVASAQNQNAFYQPVAKEPADVAEVKAHRL